MISYPRIIFPRTLSPGIFYPGSTIYFPNLIFSGSCCLFCQSQTNLPPSSGVFLTITRRSVHRCASLTCTTWINCITCIICITCITCITFNQEISHQLNLWDLSIAGILVQKISHQLTSWDINDIAGILCQKISYQITSWYIIDYHCLSLFIIYYHWLSEKSELLTHLQLEIKRCQRI